MKTFNEVLDAAMTLPVEQRADLIDTLITSLPSGKDGPLSDEWMAEIARRSAEVDAGTAELIPWEEVRRRVTASLPKNG